MKICIVIPIYNEAGAIGTVVESVKRKGLQVVVVDDGSNDGSGPIAQGKGAHVLRLEGRHGKGFALERGFEYAIEKGFDGVITMDGDGQHSSEDLIKFQDEAQRNPNTVINGNRIANAKNMPLVRYLTNRFMSSLISWACRQRVPDTQCGYRYIGCDVLKAINLVSTGFEIETEILIQASRKGFKILSVPIATIYGEEESKIHPFKDTIRFLKYFIKAVFEK